MSSDTGLSLEKMREISRNFEQYVEEQAQLHPHKFGHHVARFVVLGNIYDYAGLFSDAARALGITSAEFAEWSVKYWGEDISEIAGYDMVFSKN